MKYEKECNQTCSRCDLILWGWGNEKTWTNYNKNLDIFDFPRDIAITVSNSCNPTLSLTCITPISDYYLYSMLKARCITFMDTSLLVLCMNLLKHKLILNVNIIAHDKVWICFSLQMRSIKLKINILYLDLQTIPTTAQEFS